MLDDQALHDILHGAKPVPRVSMVNALRLQFAPGALQRLLRAALAEDQVRVGPVKAGEEERERLRLLDLLEWANAQPAAVDMELFPAGDYGIDTTVEEDMGGFPEDEADEEPELPF